ncbi:TetR family transcriptional regulator [Nocardia brasiliensis]|uniref:TetR family transcriptional regulator n=1 Tax=Nocardia brasiliensis TaxID=37326 RepID=UPI0037946DAE
MVIKAQTRRQIYAAETRAALLEAGRKSFVERGYAATSIEDITAAVLISKGAFYRHFDDKQALFAELFTERLRHAADLAETALTQIRSAPPGEGAALAIGFAYAFAELSVTDPVHRELLRQAPEALGEQKYTALDDEIVLPPITQLLTLLTERKELRAGVPLETTARLLLRQLCASNIIIAAAPDHEAMLAECATTMMLFFTGLLEPTVAG